MNSDKKVDDSLKYYGNKKGFSKIYTNIDECPIVTTETDLRNKYIRYIKKTSDGQSCSAFAGLCVTCIIPAFTANFNDIASIPNSGFAIKIIFATIGFAFGLTSVYFFYKWIKYSKKFNENSFIKSFKKHKKDISE